MTNTHAPGPGSSGGGHGRRGRRRGILALLSYEPDAEELFLKPGTVIRLSRARSDRRRAGRRFRGDGRGLRRVAALAGLAVIATLGGAAVARAVVGEAQAAGFAHGAPGLSRAHSGTAPSRPPAASGPPSVPAAGLNPMTPAPAATPGRNATSRVAPVLVMTTASGGRAVVVRYAVDSRGESGFQAEVDVSNNGTSPISGWQIVVVLPHDQVEYVQNATGYVSHHILLLQPASSQSSQSSLSPGATLRVILTVQGTETTPELCAFDNTACR